jgi:uncharacterized protein (TIGR02270 family)
MVENSRPAGVLHLPGFSPRQISTLINREIVEEHADNAGALWRMHAHAVDAPLYRLRDLALLDERIVAHLEGLRIAGGAGVQLARRGLASGEPAAVFVAAYLAFLSSDTDAMRQIVQVSMPIPAFTDALIAALSWLEFEVVQEPLRLLARSESSSYRRLAVAVTAAHRVRSEHGFGAAAADADPELSAVALRAIGETKTPNLESVLAGGQQAPEPSSRFWANWSMALFGDDRAAVEAFRVGIEQPALSRKAIEIGMRTADPQWAREQIRSLVRAGAIRQAIVAAGAFGDPLVVQWLLQMMEHTDLAKPAAESVAMITGVDLEAAEFKRDGPEDPPELPAEDHDLRWPSRDGLTAWWEREQHRFTAGERYLAGRRIGEHEALEVLRSGYQRQRRAAAIELARLRRDAMIFPTTSRADWQQGRLGS